MGSNTSTNTDTNNIYTEQQYVETVEDKYAELLRQNELLRQENGKAKEDNQKLKEENELLKSGNYNLQRDNDRLRGDIYNLRLENRAVEADKEVLDDKLMSLIYETIKTDDQIEELKCEIQELNQKLPKTNLLPKVAEKEDHRQFMLDCVISNYYQGFPNYQEYVNQQTKLIETIICSDEYIVSCPSGGETNCLVTNKGKIFQKAKTRTSNQPGALESHSWGYTNLELIIETEMVLNLIVGACQDVHGLCGYDTRLHKCTLGLTCRGKWSNGYN